MATTPHLFDGPAFAKWLRRWKDAEHLEWGDIADRSALHKSTIQGLARGIPQKKDRVRGQTDVNPPINTFVRLANGLGLDLSYVLSKGGIAPGGHDRWDAFSNAERELMVLALTHVVPPVGAEALADTMIDQLSEHLTEEVPA